MLVPNIFNGINIYKLNAYAKHRPTWGPVSHIVAHNNGDLGPQSRPLV
jgi:hypothetical protein